MTPHITNDRINLDNVGSFISILETAFGDPEKVATAERKLRNLWQANRDFSTYYAEFVRYATDTTWNEAAKRSQLEEGLCHELKNDLIARDEPKLFADFIALLQKLDQKRRRLTASAQGGKAACPLFWRQFFPSRRQVHRPRMNAGSRGFGCGGLGCCGGVCVVCV